nr:GNAT family N-acetyltransferase [uncultured Eisenbergiella sp.]
MEYKITKYKKEYEKQWDDFVENESINGTFLQQWKFLNYHTEGRFNDCSIMFWNKDNLVGVCPACVLTEKEKKVFYSHMGSTYGGLLISKELLRVEKMKVLLEAFDDYLKKQNFDKCVIKTTMDILCCYPQDILEFSLCFFQYQERKELNFYIDYDKYNPDIINNFSKMKRRNVKRCINTGFELKELIDRNQIKDFHHVLTANLYKYDKKPIHTVNELCNLKNRLKENIEFYGAYLDGKLMAGTMVFLFEKVKCAHTQYLAADPKYKDLNPMAFIYYRMAEMFSQRKYRYLSWGIATEHLGSDINYSLANNKEEFGSIHGINRIYEKYYELS